MNPDKLTRLIIFEKLATNFSSYREPNDVPDFLWEKITTQIYSIHDADEKLNFISKNIFSFFLNNKECHISPVMYDPTTFSPIKFIYFPSKEIKLKISFTELYFEINFIDQIPEWLKLKETICKTWESKTFTN